MRARWIGGAMLAAAAAGPVFVLLMLGDFAVKAGSIGGSWEGLPLMLLFAGLFGFALTLLPSIAAAAALAGLGRGRRWARHPLAWAVAGAVIGWAVGALLIVASGNRGFSAEMVGGTYPFYGAGALCALLARWPTRWPEERSTSAEARTLPDGTTLPD